MADNKTNLVDLTLLNTAYKINKKRIDNLSEKITTKSLNVGTATTNGTLNVYSGDFSATSLEVNGGMTINGGGAVLPSDKALTLNGGGSVKNSANFDSLTGSVKFGNAVDADGNVTGSAQIVVPTGERLSLSGSAVTNSKTTIEGTITASSNPSVSGSLHATDTEVTSGTTITGAIIASNTNNKTLTVYGNLNAEDTNVTSGTTITGAIIASNTGNKTLTVSGTATLQGSTIGSATINSSKNGSINILDNSTLSVSGTATLKESTIGSATIKSGTVTVLNTKELGVSGTATLNGSTIGSATIENGTVNLNSNTLTVSKSSTITNTVSGSTVTLNGVGAIDATSMTLKAPSSGASLNISNELGKVNPTNGTALACTGGISAAKVYNAVWNDLADAIEVPFDTELEYGYCYKYKAGRVYKTDSYADANVMGIHSDTAGMVLGTKDKGVVCINLAVAGVVLAYVDKEYECGTALVATKEGKLTKANRRTRLFHPERIVATFYKKEIQDFWGSSTHKVAVNGRSWVKVR